MKKNIIFFLFVVSFCSLISCKNKKTKEEEKKTFVSEEIENNKPKIIEKPKEIEKQSEIIETPDFIPISLYKKYDFAPIDNPDFNLVDVILEEDNDIIMTYDNKKILIIDDITEKLDGVISLFKIFHADRLHSSAFSINSKGKLCYGVVSLEEGYVKIYEKIMDKHSVSFPYYSGKSNYFIFTDDWIVKNSYYDVWTYKDVPAVYSCFLFVYDINTDSVVYSVNSAKLHENVKLPIDEIEYENNNFIVTLGNCFDSDEYVTFKLFTEDNNFNYEIYDKYSYAQDD